MLLDDMRRIKKFGETAPSTQRDLILLLEECHQELRCCKKWPFELANCMCLHCRVERAISQNKNRVTVRG
jgi:hypothetical protein